MTTWVGSPNYTKGREGKKVSLIVVHHMAGTLAATDVVFQDKTRNTSAHYGVGRDGTIHQYVDEANTAYHAGDWSTNLISIGIEHEDLGTDSYTDTEYATSAQLIRDIGKRYGIAINSSTVRPHKDFVATACPGTLDIGRLIKEANGGSVLDIESARILAYYVGGNTGEVDPKTGNKTKNALAGEMDSDLQKNEVGQDAQSKIKAWYNTDGEATRDNIYRLNRIAEDKGEYKQLTNPVYVKE